MGEAQDAANPTIPKVAPQQRIMRLQMSVMLKPKSPANWEVAPHWGVFRVCSLLHNLKSCLQSLFLFLVPEARAGATEHCSEGVLVQLVRASGEEKQEITISVQIQ